MPKQFPQVQTRQDEKISSCDVGLAAGTSVMTLEGEILVEFLNPGDQILTRRGVRFLKAIARHTLPAGTPRVVVTADALGGKPERDTILMPGQRLIIRDWRAQAIWGKDIVAPQVGRLVDGEFIRREEGGELIMLSLFLGSPEVIYANGLELGSADKPRAKPSSEKVA